MTNASARPIQKAELVIYGDAEHGGIFQYHWKFVPEALGLPGCLIEHHFILEKARESLCR